MHPAIRQQIVQTENDRPGLNFLQGMKAGALVALGYIPISITFGVLANTLGIPDGVALLMSAVIYAGASQFMGIKLFAAGLPSWEIVLATFLLNFRHFLASASLSQRIPKGTSKKKLALLSFGITDETFSVASLRAEKKLTPEFLFGLNLIPYLAWMLGTCLGVYLGKGLPDALQSSMGIALYAMFIGLIVPSLKKSKSVLIVALAAALANLSLYGLEVSEGFAVVVSTLLASVLGAILFKEEHS